MVPNPQQQTIIQFGLTGTGNANVIARAGCGKTSTLIQLSEAIAKTHPRLRQFLGAFNKSIAEELKARIPYSAVTVQTMHAAGLRCYKSIRPTFEIDSRKVSSLARQRHAFDKKSSGVVTDAVGYAKQMGLGLPIDGIRDYTDVAIWRQIFDEHELNDEIPSDISDERIIESCVWVYGKSIEMCKAASARIDFNDMIFAPLLLAGSEDQFRYFDWVMVDELQDQNATRRILAERILKKGGRFIGVGDDRQACYAFAGADSDSMELTAKYMNCAIFPLTTTYRCPKSIVKLAQRWVPDFTAHEDNLEGSITAIKHDALWKQEFDADNDLIICRNRRPLVGVAKRLRRMNIPCVVEGGNGRGLIALAEKWGDDITIEQLTAMLVEYRAHESKKFLDKGQDERADAVVEKVAVMFDVMDGLADDDRVPELVKRIERMFDDSGESNLLKLTTVHRSKGREAMRVFLIGRNRYMPSYFAVKSAENGNAKALVQEENLEYIATTRSKRELIEVVVPTAKKKSADGDVEWWEE
jgi:superfamily I DNA/RNA helicase